MKKILASLILLFLFGCYSTFDNYSSFKQYHSGAKYYAEAKNYDNNRLAWGASWNSQREANKTALDLCKSDIGYNCFLSKEGNKNVWIENVKHLKEKERQQKIAKEKKEKEKILAQQKKTQEELEFQARKKSKTCETLGFEIGTDLHGECVLEIIRAENDLILKQKELDILKAQSDANQALALAQAAQAQAAQRQADLNSSLQMMQLGLEMMQPTQPQSSPMVNCITNPMGWTCH